MVEPSWERASFRLRILQGADTGWPGSSLRGPGHPRSAPRSGGEGSAVPRWSRTRRLLAVVAAGAWGLSGCSFVPKSRLDECHRLSQTLQAEKDRLKDTAVSLRSQNQDLNQRAADDARRLRLQEEEVQRLVQSV